MDTFRGVAVLWVILHHSNLFFDMQKWLGRSFVWFDKIANIGFLGVDMFFVISGFLITGILIEGFEQDIRVKRFYLRRCFKILPQYGLALLAGIFISYGLPYFYAGPLTNYDKDASVGSYFIFAQNFSKPIPVLAHTWSLAVEEHFYLFYPLLLFGIFRFQKTPLRRRQWLMTILMVFIFIVNVIRIIWVNKTIPPVVVVQTTFYRIDALVFGCLLKILEPHIVPPANGKRIPLAAFNFLILGMLIYSYFLASGASDRLWYTYTFAYLAPGAILVAALKGLDRFFDNGFFRWIGKNSYGIYLWHYILVFPLMKTGVVYPVWKGVVLFIGVSILAGWMSTVTVERYFLNLRKKIVP